MLDGHHPENGRGAPESPTTMLQIDRPDGELPLRFPAVIRNLMAGVVTLEVNNPWNVLKWETLKGHRGCLHLLSGGTGEGADIRGTVSWIKYSKQGGGRLSLGLELANPSPAAQELLTENLPHAGEDSIRLWDRWDQARQDSGPVAVPTKIGFVAVALLLGAVALQLVGPTPYKPFGWVLWFFGTLGVAGQTLCFWKSRKASR